VRPGGHSSETVGEAAGLRELGLPRAEIFPFGAMTGVETKPSDVGDTELVSAKDASGMKATDKRRSQT
jgi:hypothetical protein